MEKDRMQQALNDAYAEWKSVVPRAGLELSEFTAPQLLKVTPGYAQSVKKILIFGQETKEWTWDKEELSNNPKWIYPPYPFRAVRTLADFVDHDDAIDALLWGYEKFDFGRAQGETGLGFWRGFYELVGGFPGAMATNVAKCHSLKGDCAVASLSPIEFRQFASMQKEVVEAEIAALAPDTCIFLSGPDYDGLIEKTFEGTVFESVHGFPENVLARVASPALPPESFRTYHPGRWRYESQYRNEVGSFLRQLIPPSD